MADVFISYHEETQIARVNQIAAILKKAGITCWYAKRDVTVGEDFTAKVIQQIKDCKVFLVLLDEGAEHYRHVKTEVGIAFKYDKKIMPYQTDTKDLQNVEWVQYYLEHTQIIPLPDYDTLTEQIVTALGRPIKTVKPEPQPTKSQPINPRPKTAASQADEPKLKPRDIAHLEALANVFMPICVIMGSICVFLWERDASWIFVDDFYTAILRIFMGYFIGCAVSSYVIIYVILQVTGNYNSAITIYYSLRVVSIIIGIWLIIGVILGIKIGYMISESTGAVFGMFIAFCLCTFLIGVMITLIGKLCSGM